MTQGALDFSGHFSGNSEGGPRAPAGPPGMWPRERVLIAPGPRAAEALLLREIARACGEARANPRLLALPVRVIVPSRSLREHVAAKLVQAHTGLAGVVVQTLRGFARELLRRAGEPELDRGGELLLPVLVRRVAGEFEALREVLSALDEGYAPLVESVRDLLDAGLDESNAESADEALAAVGDDAQVARARAIVALALRARAELAELGLASPAALFRSGREVLEQDPSLAASREIWIHGYADVTGVQLDLIEQLVGIAGARVVLDHPPDPMAGGGVGAFTQRLRERLGAPALPREPSLLPKPPVLRRAPGVHAEVRAAAEQIREILDAKGGDAAPESIALVARNLQPYRFAIATHLRRLGIPFSGGTGFVDPAGRRLRALLALLDEGGRAAADRWLDASALRHDAGLDLSDLRLALHTLGRGRLAEVAALEVEAALAGRSRYRLPVRARLEAGGDLALDSDADPLENAETLAPEPVTGIARAERRSVSPKSLAWARDDAAAALAALGTLAAGGTLAEHVAALRTLTEGALRWRRDTPGRVALDAALAGLARELPAALRLDVSEFRVLLSRALRDVGVGVLGGRGGGVQVLSATAARARTFSHLFVLGLERDVFPRVVTEDPLLPDRLRRRLEVVLPDVPIKARGYAEERFLFAQLCASAASVNLSWQETTDDGKERPVSPLVQRLRIAHGLGADTPAAPLVWSEREAPRPAHEHALLAGLAGDRSGAEHATALALAPLLGAGASAAARARDASLAFRDEWAPPRVLGPHLGQIGPVLAATSELSVTRLEALSHCPWRAFLEKLLGLQPPPDALAALPELSPLLLGNSVHGALEEIARRAGVPVKESLAQAREAASISVPWPSPSELTAIVLAAARAAASDQGILLPGFAELLAHRAAAYLERARELDWPHGALAGVRGVEATCELDLPIPGGAPLRLSCRADRVDEIGGRLVLTDYKTGKPISDAKQAKTRKQHLLDAVVEGKKLQAAAYAMAAGGASAGRYLFVKPGLAAEVADARVESDPPASDVLAAFEQSAERAVRQWRTGELLPLLIADDADSEGPSCKFCEVSEACWKGDASAKRRLAAWQESTGAAALRGGAEDDE